MFAIGETTRQEADRSGYDAGALAVAFAVDQARAMADHLGVDTGPVSLIAQYQDVHWAEDRMLVPYGVAVTISDELIASWHRLAAPAPVPTGRAHPGPRAPTPFPSPKPSPMPTAVHIPWATGSSQPPIDVVPIDVADPATSITAEGDARVSATADALRVSLVIERGEHTPQDNQLKYLPDPDELVRKLRAQQDVLDVAVQESDSGPLPVGYQLILRTHDVSRVSNATAMVTSAYRRFRVAARFDVALVLTDCAHQVLLAQEASADQAVQRAIDAANNQGRRLRRLLLAAAYPPQNGDECLNNAQQDALDRVRDNVVRVPADRTVMLRVPVKMTFRTYSK